MVDDEDLGHSASVTRTAKSAAYPLAMLLVIYTLNFVDRQVIAILAAPIKEDLGLNNTQIGLITGFAFALFYSILGVPIAWLADRFNRVTIIAAACALWSAMTALCGLAGNFVQLFAARVGVGVGEAGCLPASVSLISDLVPEEKRASALAIFAMGVPLGTVAGLWVGGAFAEAYGWRNTLYLLGAVGIVIALIAAVTMRDPGRVGPGAEDSPDMRRAVPVLLKTKAFRGLTIGASLAALGAYGLVAFLGVYLVETFDLSLSEAGFGLGLAIGVGGAAGSWTGGALSTRFNPADRPARIAGIGLILAVPFLIAALVAQSAVIALIALGGVAFFNAFWYGPVFAGVQTIASPRSRAMAMAVFNLTVNLIGLGLGPVAIGLISDALIAYAPGADGLREGLGVVAVFNLLAATILLSVVLKPADRAAAS